MSNTAASEGPLAAPAGVAAREASGWRQTALPVSRRQAWMWLGLVVALFCLPLFVNLGGFDLANDEAGHSFSVDVMLSRGDWLTPKSSPSESQPFLEKPPLKFWIVALPIRLGVLPHNEFGLRFWDALFGSVAFLYVFAIGRVLGGPVCGFVAVLMLFVHRPLLFDHGVRSNNMEAALLLSYCGGIFHFLAWRASPSPSRRRWHVIGVALYFVLGFMVKFVAVVFLPVVLAAAALSSGDDRARLRRDARLWSGAAALAVLLIAPWFVYEYHRYGATLVDTIFGTHVYTRFTRFLDRDHLHPWHYYLTQMFSELRASHTALLVLVGLVLVSARLVRTGWREGLFILLWFAPVAILSLGTSKLYHYEYPYLPPVALIAGYGAAVLARACWAMVDPPLRKVERFFAEPIRRIVRPPAVRVIFTLIAIGAAALAVATYATGPIHLVVGDEVLFKNSSVLRAAIVAFLALILAGRLGTSIRLTVLLLVVAILPVSSYRSQLSALSARDDTLRSLRDCLQPISARFGSAADPRGPGVYVEGQMPSHAFVYYLRALGPWWDRSVTSDPTVYTMLYVPGTMRPVLLSAPRYEEFMSLVNAGDQVLIDRAARKAGLEPSSLRALAGRTPVSIVRFPADVLMLPGPYNVCAFTAGKTGR